MAAPFWQAGNFYLPGDLVQPVTAPAPNNPQVTNGGFAGATGWTFSGSAAYTASGGYGGGGCVQLPGNQPDGVALNNAQLAVPVGATMTATAMIQQGASVAGATAGWAEVRWYSATNVELSIDKGNVVDSGSGGAWHQSKVDAVCPAGAAYARAAIHLTSVADHNHAIFGDNLSVSGASAGLPEGLVYRAVQPESGTSGANEPAWPGILGLQVVDNDVIWEAVTTSRITWTASPRYVSGATEPTWPIDIGSMVQDGTINWEAVSRRVEDERCPNSKVVAIVASKVFAVDKDIVKFCATANPLDWSTADDAGYLPTGLQQANSNDMAVLQQYRANLVALNASSFQNWQVDPDPAAMAILDQMDGIGSVWPKAAVPVSNDLFYLSQLGVRTVGIANAAENLSAGDVGSPIDSLIQSAIQAAISGDSKVVATYYPGAGQYWLSFGNYPPPDIVVAGNLPEWSNWRAYEGRIPIFNAIGACSIITVGGDTLPAGWSVSIDNAAKQVVVAGPANLAFVAPTLCLSLTIRDSMDREAAWSGCLQVRTTPSQPEHVTTWLDPTSGATFAVPLPPGVSAGDMLIFLTVVAGSGNPNFGGLAPLVASRMMGAVTRGCVHYRVATGEEGGLMTLTKPTGGGRAAGIIYHFKEGAYLGVPQALFDPPANNQYDSQNPPALAPTWPENYAIWIGGFAGRTTTDIVTWPFATWRAHTGTADGGAIPSPGAGGIGTSDDREIVSSASIQYATTVNPAAYVTGPVGGSMTGARVAFTVALQLN